MGRDFPGANLESVGVPIEILDASTDAALSAPLAFRRILSDFHRSAGVSEQAGILRVANRARSRVGRGFSWFLQSQRVSAAIVAGKYFPYIFVPT